MNEPDADRCDNPAPDADPGLSSTCGAPVRGGNAHGGSAVTGEKTTTVFGALFGAAAAVPT